MILNSPTISGSLTVTGNIITSGSITISGSIASASYASNADLLDGLDSTVFTLTSSFNRVSSSVATTGSNTFTAVQHVTDTTVPAGFANASGSIYTDGGLLVTKDSYFSGSMFIKGDLTIYGTQSIAYITSSQLNIATNLITVNTSTPSIRFGGIAVQDSGSATGLTGSLLWDSQNNAWIYDNPSGSGNYDSAMVIMGPRNASSLGSEQGLTCNYLVQGHGHHHTTSSLIYHDSSATCFYGGNASVTSTGGITVSDNLAYSTGVNSWYINTGINGAVLRLKACGSAAGYANRSGALGWTDNSGVKADILGWDDNCITALKPVISCGNILMNTTTGAGVGTNEITINTAGTAALNMMVNNTLTAYQYANNASSIYATATNIPMVFITCGCERARITGAGSVGIGLSNPEGVLTIKGTSAQLPSSGTTSNSLLQIVGSLGAELNIGSNTVAGGYGSYIQASDNNLAVYYQLNLQPNGGNVGIGTGNVDITSGGILDVRQSNASNMSISFMNTCGATSTSAQTVDIISKLVGSGLTGQIGSLIRTGKEGDYSSGGLRDAYLSLQVSQNDTLVERLRISSDGTSCFGGNVCANTFSAYGMFGKYYGVTCTVGSSVAIMDTGISISNNNAWLVTFTGNPAAAGGVYSWSEVGTLVVNSQYNGSTLTQMITYTKIGGGGTSVYPGALTLYPYFLISGVECTQTASSQPSGQIRLKICGYSNTPGTSTAAWLTQLY